jgi:hypothetical protein
MKRAHFVSSSSVGSLFSLVLAVVVPSSIEGALFAEFSALRDGWSNGGGEVKGSKLTESQAAQLVDLASRHDLLVKFFAVDMAAHNDAVVTEYKSRQADGVIAHLTPEHHPNLVAQLQGLTDAIRRMPNRCQELPQFDNCGRKARPLPINSGLSKETASFTRHPKRR